MSSQKPARLLDGLNTAMRVTAAACLLAMAVVTGIDVAGSGFFNTPLFGAEEIVSILAVIVVGFALPFAHTQGSNIGVEFFISHLSRKIRERMKFVTDLAAFGLFSLVAWRMFVYGSTIRDSGMVSMNLELPTYWIIYALAFGFSVFALFLLRDALHFLTKDKS